jgi:hypothetical protein
MNKVKRPRHVLRKPQTVPEVTQSALSVSGAGREQNRAAAEVPRRRVSVDKVLTSDSHWLRVNAQDNDQVSSHLRDLACTLRTITGTRPP